MAVIKTTGMEFTPIFSICLMIKRKFKGGIKLRRRESQKSLEIRPISSKKKEVWAPRSSSQCMMSFTHSGSRPRKVGLNCSLAMDYDFF
jgi:hypothetical protein